MKDTITYRPTIRPEKLTRIIRGLDYPKVNRFIDEAVREKIGREAHNPHQAKTEALLWEVMEVLGRYKGLKLLKPNPRLAADIDRKAEEALSKGSKGRRVRTKK